METQYILTENELAEIINRLTSLEKYIGVIAKEYNATPDSDYNEDFGEIYHQINRLKNIF